MPNDNPIKSILHSRNPHRFRYDFDQLIASCPELSRFVTKNQYGNESLDFADPLAVQMLNKALLMHFYGISFWEIPSGYLCPPIPGRADYIHYLADLLTSCNSGILPAGKNIAVLDIGVGANCVYPIIGSRSYAWHFVGTDIDPVSIKSAQKIIDLNEALNGLIELRFQESSVKIFSGIMKSTDVFDLTMCNPPFHSSLEEASAGTLRKLTNLGSNGSKKIVTPQLNFGGQNNELWYPGGEVSFIRNMINESLSYKKQCLWFTTLVSKKDSLDRVYAELKRVSVAEVRTIAMAQGQKTSRIVAWTFFNKPQKEKWSKEHWV